MNTFFLLLVTIVMVYLAFGVLSFLELYRCFHEACEKKQELYGQKNNGSR